MSTNPNNPNNLRVIQREIVSGLIFSEDGMLLMGKKDPSKGGVYSDCWHIPGGGVDADEDNLSALKREVLEETNLDITSAKVYLADDQGKGATEKTLKEADEKVWVEMNFNVYSVELADKAVDVKLNPSDDLVELRWFSPAELRKVKLTPPSEQLFSRLKLI